MVILPVKLKVYIRIRPTDGSLSGVIIASSNSVLDQIVSNTGYPPLFA